MSIYDVEVDGLLECLALSLLVSLSVSLDVLVGVPLLLLRGVGFALQLKKVALSRGVGYGSARICFSCFILRMRLP